MIIRSFLVNSSRRSWRLSLDHSSGQKVCKRIGKELMQIKGRNAYYSNASDDGQGAKKKAKIIKPLSSRFKEHEKVNGNNGNNGLHSLTLEHFLLRDKCIKLWRDFIRASRNIPNPIARRETVDWLRDEHFEGAYGLRNETDITRIRELLVSGNVALKRVCGPMELVAALNPKHGSFPKLRGKRE